MKIEKWLEGDIIFEPSDGIIYVKKDGEDIKEICYLDIMTPLNLGDFIVEAIKEKLQREEKEHNTFGWVHKRGENL